MELLKAGAFDIGCNYWASHAGTRMWNDWRPDIIDSDFAALSVHDIRLIRVFPLWSVFQPITALYGQNGIFKECRFDEEPLPDTFEGKMGVSVEALDRFEQLCRLAQSHKIHLIVGLITGWMSGRLYAPPALEGKNLITDPAALMWETRFVRCFVKRFSQEDTIVAWDLGNECNCLSPFDTAEEMYAWTSNIAGAIRSEDTSRPVISGMHGLLPEGKWNIFHQAELTDLLTTHPYPLYTPYCDAAPINTLRTELHGTAETLFYRGIGRKPCFVEEAGTLGPMLADDETAAVFVRTCLFSLWAHDCRGFLWWCANDQKHLSHAPYDWTAFERELGLFRSDGSPKPVLKEMQGFSKLLKQVGISHLPQRLTDGICILTHGQDTWAAAYMSFVLGKQAGLDLEFAYAEQELPESNCYLLPSIRGDAAISLHRLKQLLTRVEKGAVLYISLDDGFFSDFERMCGVRVKGRERVDGERIISICSDDTNIELSLYFRFHLELEPGKANVLARNEQGDPVCCVCPYGKGAILLLTAPVETFLAQRPGRITSASSYYRFYDFLRQRICSDKAARLDSPDACLTEHILSDTERLLIAINYDPEPVKLELSLRPGWKAERFLYGSKELRGNDAAVIKIIRQ